MNKKGLIGKIILVLLLIVLVIIAAVGFTIYQAYNLMKLVQTESVSISANSMVLAMNKNCSKIPEIEASMENIKTQAESACKNPLLRIAVDKMQQISIKCSGLSAMYENAQSQLAPMKILCANQTKLAV